MHYGGTADAKNQYLRPGKKIEKQFLEKLQRMKVMEISQILEEDPDFTTMDTRQERMELEKSASLSDQALEILDRYAPEKKSMVFCTGRESADRSR